MEINWKNILILMLVFVLGFGTGMMVTFINVFKKLEGYGFKI